MRPHVPRRLRRLVLLAVAACLVAASIVSPASAAARPSASTARLDAKGVQLVENYLRQSRRATTSAQLAGADATARRIFTHVRGASARSDKRSLDTVATYVVRVGLPELRANLGTSLVLYNDALGHVTKASLFELMRLSPDVLHRVRDTGTTIHVGDRPITTMGGLGELAGTAPRGHEASELWEHIGGAYDPSRNVVVAGRGHARYGRFTGTILHELGHAYDATTRASFSPELRSLQQRIGARTNAYYALPGDAGPQEYFADLCRAYWSGGTARVTADFGAEPAAWMKRNVPR